MEESESLDEQTLLQTDDSQISIGEYNYEEMAEYGNGMFIKLRDCDISATANMKFDNSSEDTDKATDQENGIIAVPSIIDLSFHDIKDCTCLQNVLEELEINTLKNTYIQELNLSNNSIRGHACVKNIISFLENADRLEILNLSGNILNEEAALSALTRSIIDSNETLQVLRLGWNGISGEVCANIFKNLMIRTKSLKILDLSWNNFSDIGKILGQGINQTKRLEYLDLSNNPLTDADIVDLLSCIADLTSLRSLGITHVFADEQIENAINKAQSRIPNCSVKVAVYTGIKTDPVIDKQALYLKRMHFLGVTMPKKQKNKIDIGHVLLKMKIGENLEPMKLNLFVSTFRRLKIKGIGELLGDLASQFKNPDKTINVALMLDKYLELYPKTKLE